MKVHRLPLNHNRDTEQRESQTSILASTNKRELLLCKWAFQIQKLTQVNHSLAPESVCRGRYNLNHEKWQLSAWLIRSTGQNASHENARLVADGAKSAARLGSGETICHTRWLEVLESQDNSSLPTLQPSTPCPLPTLYSALKDFMFHTVRYSEFLLPAGSRLRLRLRLRSKQYFIIRKCGRNTEMRSLTLPLG